MQTESSVTKTSGSSSKTSKPAAANIDGHFSHYVLWEQRFQWAYYSHSKEGWLCKTCKEFCDSGDQYWKTKAVKHGEHPRDMFSRHQESAKHGDTKKSKYSVLKIIHKKGNIKDQLKRGFMNKKANNEEENESVTADFVEFLKDVGDKEIVNFLNRARKNATHKSKFTVEDYICYISDYLEGKLIDDITLTEDFSLLADESTNEADRSELLIFVHYVDLLKHCPVEKILGRTQVLHSKNAADLAEIIKNFLLKKVLTLAR